MTYPVDPASLEGDALARWYLRSPQEIEQERHAAEAQRYDAFFGAGLPTSQPLDAVNQGPPAMGRSAQADQPGHVWIASGPNRWSSQPAPSSHGSSDESWHPDGTTPRGNSNRGANQLLAANNWFCDACHGTGIAPPPPARAKSSRLATLDAGTKPNSSEALKSRPTAMRAAEYE